MHQTLTWRVVDQAAEHLGATEAARLKWRQEGRGVPAAWRIKIASHMAATGEPIEMTAFDKLPTTPGRIAA